MPKHPRSDGATNSSLSRSWLISRQYWGTSPTMQRGPSEGVSVGGLMSWKAIEPPGRTRGP
jgi:hypothetical protein